MRIAVTAASGQLGSAVVRALKTFPGVTPIAVARTPSRAASLGVETRAGDYDDGEGLEDAFRGVDTLLLVSGMAPPEARILQHKRAIDAAKRAGVEQVVYTGILARAPVGTFASVQRMSLETERYLRESGMAWTVGRNGIYIEPDLEYLDAYAKAGRIVNSAGDGRCAYTSRSELAAAYGRLLTEPRHRGRTYTLAGEAITQSELADALNAEYGTRLAYEPMSVEAYRRDRVAEMGEAIGLLIAGIYEGISEGAWDAPSEFAEVVGRPHASIREVIRAFRAEHGAPKGS